MRRKGIISLFLVICLLLFCVPDVTVFATEPLVNIDKIIPAESRSFFIGEDGKLYASGLNTNGIAGLGGLTLSTNKAVEVPFISNVKSVAANSSATYFVLDNGDVYVGGVCSGVSSVIPVKLEGLSEVDKIATKGNSVIALKKDGTVYIQGDNSKGQLGAGNLTTVSTFTKLSGVSGVIDVQMGNNFSVFLFESGVVKATGVDLNGRLGLGNEIDKTTTVTTLTNVKTSVGISKIAVGESQILYLGMEGNLYTTGSVGTYTGVSPNNSKGINVPTLVTEFNNKTIKDIKSAEGSFVLLSDNTLWTVGLNSYGQGVTGNSSSQSSYNQVASNVSEVYVGKYQTFIKTTSGTIKAVGKNINGELGIDSTANPVLSLKQVVKGSLKAEDKEEVSNSVIKKGKIYFKQAALVDNKLHLSGSGEINGDALINNGFVQLDWTTYIRGNLLVGSGVSNSIYRSDAVTGNVSELSPKVVMPVVNEGLKIPTAPVLENKGSVVTNWNNASPVIKGSGAYETIIIQSGYTLVIDTEGREVFITVKNFSIGQGFIDIVGGGTVHLYLKNDLEIGQGSLVNNSGSSEQLNIYTSGSGSYTISGNAEVKANIYGSSLSVSIGNGGKHIGNIYVGGTSINFSGAAPLLGNLYAPNANATLDGSSGIVGNIILGGTTVNLNGATSIRGGVYAPRADVTLSGSAAIIGGLISKSVVISGGSYINYEFLTVDVPGYIEEVEEPTVPEEPEVPVVEEPKEDDEVPSGVKDLEYDFILNVVSDGHKEIGAPLAAYGAMLEHVDDSNNNYSLKRVSKLIDIFGTTFSKDLKQGTYNFYEE